MKTWRQLLVNQMTNENRTEKTHICMYVILLIFVVRNCIGLINTLVFQNFNKVMGLNIVLPGYVQDELNVTLVRGYF